MSKKKKILLISSLVALVLIFSFLIYLKFFKENKENEKSILTEREKRIRQLQNFKKPEGEGIKTTEEIEKEMDMVLQEYLKNKEKNKK